MDLLIISIITIIILIILWLIERNTNKKILSSLFNKIDKCFANFLFYSGIFFAVISFYGMKCLSDGDMNTVLSYFSLLSFAVSLFGMTGTIQQTNKSNKENKELKKQIDSIEMSNKQLLEEVNNLNKQNQRIIELLNSQENTCVLNKLLKKIDKH